MNVSYFLAKWKRKTGRWGRFLGSRALSSKAFEHNGDTLAAADTHGHQGIAAACPLQFIDRLDGDDGTGGAYRVAKGNARAIGVDPGRVQAQFTADGAGLGGEGLVGFDYIEIAHFEPGTRQSQARGWHGADAHVQRVDAGVAI